MPEPVKSYRGLVQEAVDTIERFRIPGPWGRWLAEAHYALKARGDPLRTRTEKEVRDGNDDRD